MAVTDTAITVAGLLKIDFVDETSVRLCDGGFLYFTSDSTSEKYEASDSIYGTLADPGEWEMGFGDQAEGGTITLAPPDTATFTDWYGDHLLDARVRLWFGEVSGSTVSSAEQVADMLIDTYEQEISAGGQRILQLGLISRAEKLFLRNEGNVCSERFHKSVWTGENGFNNCTDLAGYVAWGAESPPRSGTTRFR